MKTDLRLFLDANQNPTQVLPLTAAVDVKDESFEVFQEVIRVAAITDVRINDSDGVYLPAGAVEYFSVECGNLFLISGHANIMGAFK